MKSFPILMAVMFSSPSLGLFGQSKLFNFTTGRESFLIRGSIGAPLTNIFCWKEKVATLGRFWESVSIEIVTEESEETKVHFGKNVETVEEEAALDAVFWFQSSPSLIRGKIVRTSPFRKFCIAVTTSETYHVTGHLYNVDVSLLALSLAGLALFSSSTYLARLRSVACVSSLMINFLSVCLCSHWTRRKLRLILQTLHTAALLTVTFLLCSPRHDGGAGSFLTWGTHCLTHSPHQRSHVFSGYVTTCIAISMVTTRQRSARSIALFLKMVSLGLVWASSYNQVASSLVVACMFVLSSPFATEPEQVVKIQETTSQALDDLRRYC